MSKTTPGCLKIFVIIFALFIFGMFLMWIMMIIGLLSPIF